MGFAVGGMAAYAQEPDNALADLWSQELAHRISGLAARGTWNSISLPKQRCRQL